MPIINQNPILKEDYKFIITMHNNNELYNYDTRYMKNSPKNP